MLSLYIVIAVYSLIYAYRRLNRPGVSKEVRYMFVRKHGLYVIVFISVWTMQECFNYYQLFNPPYAPSSSDIVDECKANAYQNQIEYMGYLLGFRLGPDG